MMRIRLLAVPALAALMLPAISEAGVGLRGRIGTRSGHVISVTPIGTTNSAASTTKTQGAAAPAATPAPAPVKPLPPPVPGAPAIVAGPSCGPNGCGDGGCGGHHHGLFSKLFGDGSGCGDGKHGGCLANHPPEFGNGHQGFGFCQPPFQAVAVVSLLAVRRALPIARTDRGPVLSAAANRQLVESVLPRSWVWRFTGDGNGRGPRNDGTWNDAAIWSRRSGHAAAPAVRPRPTAVINLDA